jgi:U3 small nucleolar RNA-associated protein 13
MRIYSLRPSPVSALTLKYELLRTLKPHTSPVVVLAVDHTSTLLATGAADGVVKVWDIIGGYNTHTFRGPNVLVSALHFFELAATNSRDEETGISARNRKKVSRKNNPEEEDTPNGIGQGFRLASGSQNGNVRIWDLTKRTCISFLDSHVSDVTALDYAPEENMLLTGSRDKTIMWWDAKTWKNRKVVPVLEEIEAASFLEAGRLAYTGGVSGNIRVWQTDNGREVTKPQPSNGEADAIVQAISFPDLPFVLSVQADHTMSLHSTAALSDLGSTDMISSLVQLRKISGTHDEIIDLGYLLPDRSLLALATNSEEIRIVSLGQGGEDDYFGADVAQLRGHDDYIICLDIDWSGHWIATGAKDNTAKLWRIDPANSAYECYATFSGHTETLGAIALPHVPPPESSPKYKSPLDYPPPYLLTGSQDQTVKCWDVPSTRTIGQKPPRARWTRQAHDKDINALDINHEGRLFASASQDRSVKIWDVEEGETQGILKGHKRGVWSVKFAPKETPIIVGDSGPAAGKGLVLTGSGDKTVKIWSLSDYSCIRTFEGHTHSILKVAWLNIPVSDRGKKYVQVASAGGDGIVKVWDVNTGESACSLDNHEDRVWALAVHPVTNMIVSGSGDSTVTFWKDTTTATQEASTAAATQFVEQEQELQNYIYSKSYRQAITLALQLNHPGRLLSLFTSVVTTSPPEAGSLSGLNAVDEVLCSLSDSQIFTLLLRIRDWNTNNKTAPVAQRILWVLVRSYPATRLANLKVRRDGDEGKSVKIDSLSVVLDALKVYSARHYKRMEELVDESFVLEFTLKEMEGLVVDEGYGGGIDALLKSLESVKSRYVVME